MKRFDGYREAEKVDKLILKVFEQCITQEDRRQLRTYVRTIKSTCDLIERDLTPKYGTMYNPKTPVSNLCVVICLNREINNDMLPELLANEVMNGMRI